MRKGLFRYQAMEHQVSSLQGGLLMTPKPCYMIITTVLVAWAVAVVLYLTTGTYERKATVEGWLEPTQGILRLYADSRNGLITEVLVAEGDKVLKGTPLLTINYGAQQANGYSVEAKLKHELLSKKQRIAASIQRTIELQQDRIAQLTQQLAHARTDVDSLSHIETLSYHQWQLTDQRFTALKVLFNDGHLSQTDFNNIQRERLNNQQQWQQAMRNTKQGKAQVISLKTDLASLPQQQANERTALENQLSDIKQQLLTLAREHQQVIYASDNGVVSSLQAKVGHSIGPHRPLLSLLPTDSAIEARLLVPVRAAGFIATGQQFEIRYDAFPYQKFGLQQGRIVRISESVLLPGEWSDTPLSINEPTYLVTANINSDAVFAYGKPISLKAGMTFSADVSLSQRTLLEWLLDPLLSVSRRL